MKNSHFKLVVIIVFLVTFLSGCGIKTTQVDNASIQKNTDNSPISTSTQQVETVQKPVLETGTQQKETPPVKEVVKKTYTLADVAKHNKSTDCWQIIDGKVYNVTSYIPYHPGGPEKVIRECGKDSTKIFDLQHNPQVKSLLPPYFVGDLK